MDPVLQWQKTLSDVDERSDPYQQRSSFLQRRVSRLAHCGENIIRRNSWMQEPRHKDKYLEKGVIYKLCTYSTLCKVGLFQFVPKYKAKFCFTSTVTYTFLSTVTFGNILVYLFEVHFISSHL